MLLMTPGGLNIMVRPFCMSTGVLGTGLEKLEAFQKTYQGRMQLKN